MKRDVIDFYFPKVDTVFRDMNIVLCEIHPEAQAEYEDHLLFYAAHGFTLTTLEDFRSEIEGAFAEILRNPLTYRLVRKKHKQRRFGPTERFHFIIYYVVKDDKITPYILAIAHPSRKPNYWIQRL